MFYETSQDIAILRKVMRSCYVFFVSLTIIVGYFPFFVLSFFVFFCVLFLYCCHRVSTQLQVNIQGDVQVSLHLMIENTIGYLAQTYCLAADRQGQGDTRLTLTPSIIPNSNYVITASD
jgi:hypothetical protein